MFDEGSGPAAAQRLAGWLRTRKDVAKLKEKAGLIVADRGNGRCPLVRVVSCNTF